MQPRYLFFRYLFAVVFLSAAVSQAGPLWFDRDGIFLVPVSEVAPVIDGELDTEVYCTLKAAPDSALYDGSNDDIYDWYDFYCTHRMVWNGDRLYIFVSVWDDIISEDKSVATWQQDNIELYFDGDNSDGEGGYDGIDDIQLRWTWDEAIVDDGIDVGYGNADDWGFDPEVMEWAIKETEYGYDLEVAIPIEDLYIEVGQEFGFETQIGDNDDAGGNAFYRWNWPGANSWMQTLNHGTAMLIEDRVVSDVLDVNLISAPPEIDGDLDDAWMDIPNVSMNTYVTIPEDQFVEPEDWFDLLMDFRAAWDMDNFYLFVTVIDEIIETELGDVWLKDGIELYFDGLNEDSGAYDGNDNQERWVFGDETVNSEYPGSRHAWMETDWGYNFELSIPFDELADIEPEEGHEFGFEIQINDNDALEDLLRETMARWWSNDNDSWQNSELFGTAMLVGEGGVAVDKKQNVLPQKFSLMQNYPNPFNPATTIVYTLSHQSTVSVNVYNISGERVAVLVEKSIQNAGEHAVTFDGGGLSSGVYICRMEADGEVLTKKMMLVK